MEKQTPKGLVIGLFDEKIVDKTYNEPKEKVAPPTAEKPKRGRKKAEK